MGYTPAQWNPQNQVPSTPHGGYAPASFLPFTSGGGRGSFFAPSVPNNFTGENVGLGGAERPSFGQDFSGYGDFGLGAPAVGEDVPVGGYHPWQDLSGLGINAALIALGGGALIPGMTMGVLGSQGMGGLQSQGVNAAAGWAADQFGWDPTTTQRGANWLTNLLQMGRNWGDMPGANRLVSGAGAAQDLWNIVNSSRNNGVGGTPWQQTPYNSLLDWLPSPLQTPEILDRQREYEEKLAKDRATLKKFRDLMDKSNEFSGYRDVLFAGSGGWGLGGGGYGGGRGEGPQQFDPYLTGGMSSFSM